MIDFLDIIDQAFAAPPVPRTMLAFARGLRLPADGGPSAGQLYDPDSHPAQLEILQAIDSPRYDRIVTLGPVQDGKTWVSTVVPALHSLIERRETLAIVMPTRAKLDSLWQTKVLPAIHGNGFTDLLPTDGAGSEGATPLQILLRTGGRAHLLSTGTSNEAGLSSITVRRVIGSEVDDIHPARRLDLGWARADAWGSEASRIEESTIKGDTAKTSRILRDYQASTASRIWSQCPHCQRFQPWEWSQVSYDPADDLTAAATARIACIHCATLISDAERSISLHRYRLVHAGQTVAESGQVIGDHPQTRVYGLRWSALDSPLRALADLCVRHRRAVQARDAEGDHDQLRQFVRDQLVMPYVGETAAEDGSPKLTAAYLAARSHTHGWAAAVPHRDQHGLFSRHIAPMPDAARRAALTIDVQGNRLYWLLEAEDDNRCQYDVAWGYEYATAGQQPWTPAELHGLLDRVHALGDELCGHAHICARGVDTGFGHDHLMPWLQRSPLWVPLAGVGAEVAAGLKRNAARGIPGVVYLHLPQAWPLPGRLLHSIDVTRVRESAQNRYLVQAGKPGAAHLPKGQATNDSFVRHLVAEEIVELPSGNRVWRKAKGGGRHDYLDLRTYALALLDLEQQRLSTPVRPSSHYGVVSNYIGA